MKKVLRVRPVCLLLSLLAAAFVSTSCQEQLPDKTKDGTSDGRADAPNETPITDLPSAPLPPGAKTAQPCQQWSKAYQVGALETKLVHEASGLEWSSVFPERLYHINDSGDGPHVYVSDRKGAGTRRVKLNNTSNGDSEDLGLGPCPDGKGQCLVFGDIGDGGPSNPILTFVREEELSKSSANTLASLKLTLETGRVDLEGLAVHPNGDVFLATKDYDMNSTRILHVPRSSLLSKNARASIVASIDFRKFGLKRDEDLVTGMDISPDGSSFLLLAYGAAFEVMADLEQVALARGLQGIQDLSDRAYMIKTQVLGQQEAIAYIDGGSSFLYNTESTSKAPLMRIDCLRR